jgi:hypothetical protein
MVTSNKKVLVGSAMVLPVLVWIFVILYYSVNVPWYDDFDPFPDFLRHWIASDSLAGNLKVLFKPNNEHRMVIGKLVTLLYFKLTGTLNFTFLHIAGACFTLGTLTLFWLAFKKSNIKWWYFLPVPFLLFQLQYHLVFLWAICSLQHQPVIFFVCLSMYLLSRNRFGWAVFAGICATYAMSNGIFVWAAGGVVLVLRTNYRQLLLWFFAGAIAVGFYFYGLSAQGNESSMAFFIKYPHLSVLGFFAFLGGLFDLFPEKSIFVRSVLPVLMGFTVMIWIAVWLLRQIFPWLKSTLNWPGTIPAWLKINTSQQNGTKSLNEFLLGILVFLLVNAFIIGLLRPRFGFFVMIVSNYKMYPALFLIVAYAVFIASSVKESVRQKVFLLSVTLSVGIWVISIFSYLPGIAERRKYLLANAFNQEHEAFGLGHVPFSEGARYVDVLMKNMVGSGVYKYPLEPLVLAKKAVQLRIGIPAGDNMSVTTSENSFLVSDPGGEISWNRYDGEYTFVRNSERFYFFKMNAHKYTGRNPFRQYETGCGVEIPFATLKPGEYDLGIVKVLKGETTGGILRRITIP